MMVRPEGCHSGSESGTGSVSGSIGGVVAACITCDRCMSTFWSVDNHSSLDWDVREARGSCLCRGLAQLDRRQGGVCCGIVEW